MVAPETSARAPAAGLQSELTAALAGDTAARNALVKRLAPWVEANALAILMRYRPVGRKRDARQELEDVVQEVFLHLLKQDGGVLRRWDPGRGVPLETYVAYVARNHARTLLRTRKRNPWTEDPTEPEALASGLDREPGSAPDPEATAARKQLFVCVLGKLREGWSARSMRLFELTVVESRPAAEAASMMGMTVEAVHTWWSRTVASARELAAELDADSSRGEGARNGRRR